MVYYTILFFFRFYTVFLLGFAFLFILSGSISWNGFTVSKAQKSQFMRYWYLSHTVNAEIFARILFSRIVSKDIFAT